MKKGFSVIACVLDRSGSMGSVVDDSIGGFNTFLKEQQKEPGEAKMTMVQFNHEYNIIHDFIDIKEVEPLTNKTYVPAGTTALLDAVGRTIDSLGQRLRNMKEKDRPENVIVVILTDGHENSSKEYAKSAIKEMIEHQQNKYNWSFIFLGANQDAFAEAAQIGIREQFTSGYRGDAIGTTYAYSGMSANVRAIRRRCSDSFNLSNWMDKNDNRDADVDSADTDGSK